jgi:hypothetical protein
LDGGRSTTADSPLRTTYYIGPATHAIRPGKSHGLMSDFHESSLPLKPYRLKAMERLLSRDLPGRQFDAVVIAVLVQASAASGKENP